MISIIIVSWNTRDLLQVCLDTIGRFPPKEPYEVIVIDNASRDDSAEMVRRQFPDAMLFAEQTNLGYAIGNNIGCKVATGDLILFLNPDTEVREGTLDVAAKALRAHDNWGAIGVKQIGVDGKVQASIRRFPTYANILGDLMGGLGDYRARNFDYTKEQIAEQPMGTFLLVKRVALRDVGDPNAPFDPQFPIFFNEVDLLIRMRKKGWLCAYTPHAEIIHHGGESTKQVRKSMIWESHRSLVRYFRKHHARGIEAIGYPFLAAAAYVGAFIRAQGYDAGFTA